MADVSNDTVIATGTPTSRSLASRFADAINVRDEGAAGNGTTDDRTAFADADTDANGNVILVPPGTYRIASNLTIASALLLLPGAKLKPDNGITVTLSKVPLAGAHAIFDLSAGTTADVDVSATAVGAINVLWWGPAGNGTTDDRKPLQAAFDAATNKSLVFPSTATYKFASSLTIANNTTIRNAGATLRLGYSDSSSTTAVTCGTGVEADLLLLDVPTGISIKRLLTLQADTTIGRIMVTSTDQQANSNDSLHGAVRITGNTCVVESISVAKFDYAVTLYNTSQVTVGHVQISSYARGVAIHSSNFTSLLSGALSTMSANASDAANHDGLWITNSNDLSVSNLVIKDAGRHGVEVLGAGNVERCTFANLQIFEPGAGGMRIAVNSTYVARHIQIGGLSVVDATKDNTPLAEAHGLALVRCQYVTVSGFMVQKVNQGTSAVDGILIDGSTSVTISSPMISDVDDNGIHLSDAAGPVNSIFIAAPRILGCGKYGIYVQSPTQILRDVIVTSCYIRSFGLRVASYGVYVDANSPSVGVNQPCLFHGWVNNESSGVYADDTTDADLRNYITSV